MASAEAGVKLYLNPKLSLYVGAYFDYGFNNVSKHSGKHFFYFDPEYIRMHSNSILSSQYSDKGKPIANFTDKVAPIAFGLKIRMGINVCDIPRVRKAKEPQVINVTVTCNCNHQCNCDSKRSAKEERRRKRVEAEEAANADQNAANNAVPQREPYTELELEEFDRARKEYGELEDLMVLNFGIGGYEVNQSRLTPVMLAELDRKIDYLQKYNSPEYEIICEGHTCDIGTANYNMSLGRRRAEVVRNRFIQKGFDPRNIKVASKGQTMPIVENSDEAHRRINRRVVFLVKQIK
jgi:outer membrane protein OmpA-like peptidoglycan-associated protein